MINSDSNFKKDYKDAIFNCCISFSEQIGQILEYYLINSSSIKKSFEAEKSKNSESFLIMNLFNSVYKCSSLQEMNETFEAIKKERITTDYTLADLFSEFTFNEEKKSFNFIFEKA